MRTFIILSLIVISIKYARCRIDLKRDKEVIVDIDSPELHQSQYHTADFDTSAYNYGYAVEPNGQFHHETRGGDGVTYGCYGYIDTDDLLKVTHYVADSQGYRTLEHEKPVLVYPIAENVVDSDDVPYKPKGVLVNWKDLYFPIGCGMAKGGVVLNAPVIRVPDGRFQQLGETKFPVQPSNEPKVVVPRIPSGIGIKIEPTKLIPVTQFSSHDTSQLNLNPSAPNVLLSLKNVSPSTETPRRSTNQQNYSTKTTDKFPFNGPDSNLSLNKFSNFPNDYTVQSTLSPTSNTNPTLRDTVTLNKFPNIPNDYTVHSSLSPTRNPNPTLRDTVTFNKFSSIPNDYGVQSTVSPTRNLNPTLRDTVTLDKYSNIPNDYTVQSSLSPTRNPNPTLRDTVTLNKYSNIPNDYTVQSSLSPTRNPNPTLRDTVTLNKYSNIPDDYTVQSTLSPSSNPNPTLRESVTPIYDSVSVVGSNTRVTSDNIKTRIPTETSKLGKFPSSATTTNSAEVQEQYSEDNTEGLFQPFRTTYPSNTQTTSAPFNSISSHADPNIINSFANTNLGLSTTSESGYRIEEKPAQVHNNDRISGNYNRPSTVTIVQPSTEKISLNRPNKFDGFHFSSQTTTDIPTEFTTDTTTVLNSERGHVSFTLKDRIQPTENSLKSATYETSIKFNSVKHEPFGFGFSTNVPTQRSAVDSSTSHNLIEEIETSTPKATYGGIGDYNKPQHDFEFNIPTKAPVQVTTDKFYSFVTNKNVNTAKDNVTPQNFREITFNAERKEPDNLLVEKLNKFTNGPHGAEYQLSSRIPQSQFNINRGQDNNFNVFNPIKQSRKEVEAKENPISLITPLTHLSISGSYPSKYDATVTTTQTEKPSSIPVQVFNDRFSTGQSSTSPPFTNHLNNFERVVPPSYPIHPGRESSRPNAQQQSDFIALTTPKSEHSNNVITHMNAISQTRYQSSRVTSSPSGTGTSNAQYNSNPNELIFNPQSNYKLSDDETVQSETSRSTEQPFVYTRSRTAYSNADNRPYQTEATNSPDSVRNIPNEESFSGSFGQRFKPDTNPATSSFTSYNAGSTLGRVTKENVVTPSSVETSKMQTLSEGSPLNYQPKFVQKPDVITQMKTNRQPISNFNVYPGAEIKNANFYPNFIQPKSIESIDKSNKVIQPENKFVNTKKEFVPQYNPNSSPIPGSLGTAIGVYPPNLDELSPEIPNFSIAISKWPFYIVPFPFVNGNIMPFPFINAMPFQLGNGNNIPLPNGINGNGHFNGVNGASEVSNSGTGAPAQTICSWLNSFIKPQVNATSTNTTTNPNGETLEISNLQVNINKPNLQVDQNTIPYGIIGFIPIIAVPDCQHNGNSEKSDQGIFPTNIQIPSLCSQLSHYFASPTNENKQTNQLPIT